MQISEPTHTFSKLFEALLAVTKRFDHGKFCFTTIRICLAKQNYQLAQFAGPTLICTNGDVRGYIFGDAPHLPPFETKVS